MAAVDGATAGTAVVSSSLSVPPALSEALREHQLAALHFLWRRLVDDGILRMAARTHSSTIEQRAHLYQAVYGCIVGHSMGLGKTLTALSFLMLLQGQVMLMTAKKQLMRGGGPRRGPAAPEPPRCPALRVLVVCPKSCVRHWLSSVEEWVTPALFGRVALEAFAPSASLPSVSVAGYHQKLDAMLERFHQRGGLLILGYEEYVRLTEALATRPPGGDWNGERVWSLLDGVRQRLPLRPRLRYLDVLEGADAVVLDEAHRLKRPGTKAVQALRRHLRNAQVRLALTGTPLQNHLDEYNVMQSVVTGSDLDSHQFSKYFVSPIQLGQCADSSYQQFTEMQKCVTSLRRYFSTTVHHCGPEELEKVLPPRHEFVLFFSLSEQQEALYRQLLDHFRALNKDRDTANGALVMHHQSSHLCLHPCLVDAALTRTATEGEEASGIDRDGEAAVKNPEKQEAEDDYEVSEGEDGEEEGEEEEETYRMKRALDVAARRHMSTEELAMSPKLLFALDLVEYITTVLDEKVVVFSLYRSHLALVQALLLDRLDPATQDPPNVFTGTSTEAQRHAYTADFQTNPRRRVLLCSVRAGGVGINLTAANHCVMLDVSWNPADDTQATYRVFRFGQRRPVTVYRLATRGTTEQVVFAYALQRSWLHKKIADVTDPTRQERHRTRSYFSYPCKAPIDDGAPTLEPPPQATAAVAPTAACNDEVVAGPREGEQRVEGKGRGHRRRGRRGSAPDPHAAALAEAQLREWEAKEKALRQRHFAAQCERECPAAAWVLQQAPALSRSLYSIVRRSFLLRDDSAETVAEMESRFREVQRRREAQAPIALTGSSDDALPIASNDTGRAVPLLEECEPALVDVARMAANHMIWHVVQQQYDAGRRAAAESDTIAVVRETDHALCTLLQPLLQPALVAAARGSEAAPTFQDMHPVRTTPQQQQQQSHTRPFASLAEVVLFLYQTGAREAAVSVLSQSSFTRLRTYLTSRIPHPSSASSAGSRRHRPRRSTLTHGALEDCLLYRPYELLSRVDPIEQTYTATEMGFVRPLVQQCVFSGLRHCLACVQADGTSSDAHRNDGNTSLVLCVRTLLREYFHTWDDVTASLGANDSGGDEQDDTGGDTDRGSSSSGSGGGGDGDGALAGHRRRGRGHAALSLSQAEEALWEVKKLLPHLLSAVERCLNDLWPYGAGFELPPQPLAIAKEEARLAEAYEQADRQGVCVGVFSLAEAGAALGMDRLYGRATTYNCPRCSKAPLARRSDTVLDCARCHYNAEFAQRSDARFHQSAVLFQLSVACNLLDGFSISKSFSSAFAPDCCDGVWDTVQLLRGGQPVFGFVHKCMTDGVNIVLDEYPAKYVQLLAVQSGAGDDRDLLRRMLLVNARRVWTDCLRRHVREGLGHCFRDLVGPCSIAALASMPLMSIILSLHFAARHEGVGYARELLSDDAGAGATEEEEGEDGGGGYGAKGYKGTGRSDRRKRKEGLDGAGWPGGRKRSLLRFACDGLVKLLYAEKLLEHCRDPPPPPLLPSAEGSSGDALNTKSATGKGFSDDEDDNVSFASSRSPSPHTHQPSNAHGRRASLDSLLYAPSSSSSSDSSHSTSSAFSSPVASRRRRTRARLPPPQQQQPHTSRRAPPHKRPRVARCAHSSESSRSASSSDWEELVSSSPSSFGTRYSSEAESKPMRDANDDDSRSIGSIGSDWAGAREPWGERAAFPSEGEEEAAQKEEEAKTAEQLLEEATLQQRSAQYWVAFCEVYGTSSVESLTVFVEDEEHGMTMLPPPPALFWVSHLMKASKEGKTVAQAVDLFIEKLLELSQKVRLIKD